MYSPEAHSALGPIPAPIGHFGRDPRLYRALTRMKCNWQSKALDHVRERAWLREGRTKPRTLSLGRQGLFPEQHIHRAKGVAKGRRPGQGNQSRRFPYLVGRFPKRPPDVRGEFVCVVDQ